MIRPYLYAKSLFRSRSQNREALESDDKFFQTLIGLITQPVVKDFLSHPLVSKMKKFAILKRAISPIFEMQSSQEDLLEIWIAKGHIEQLPAIYRHWIELVEDFFQEGVIVTSCNQKLSPTAKKALQQIFQKRYPGRKFSFRQSLSPVPSSTAQFRDSVIDLRPNVLLKKIILRLKEGF